MGHSRRGRWARGARGCLCRAPALAQGLLTSGISPVASASALPGPPFLHRQGKKRVRGERSLPPQPHQQKPEPARARAVPAPSPWPRLARARLANGLPCQAGPLQPTPGAAPGPLMTPTPLARARLRTGTDSCLGLGHTHLAHEDTQQQQRPQDSRVGDDGRGAEHPTHCPRHDRHACEVPERPRRAWAGAAGPSRQSTRSSFPAQEPLSSPVGWQAKCRPAWLGPAHTFRPCLWRRRDTGRSPALTTATSVTRGSSQYSWAQLRGSGPASMGS